MVMERALDARGNKSPGPTEGRVADGLSSSNEVPLSQSLHTGLLTASVNSLPVQESNERSLRVNVVIIKGRRGKRLAFEDVKTHAMSNKDKQEPMQTFHSRINGDQCGVSAEPPHCLACSFLVLPG